MNESTNLRETCNITIVKKNGNVIVKKTKEEHSNEN